MAGDAAGRASAAAGRLPALDGLRGAAVLLVLAAHFLSGTLFTGAFGILSYSFGPAGVLLFFLLSGYLIFRNLQRQSLPVFLARRLFKLLPAYWLNLLVIAALGLLLPDAPRFTARAYAANFVMLPDLLRQDLVNGGYWTLIIEIKFYLLAALQFRLLGNRHVLAVPAAILAANLGFWLLHGRGSVLLSYLPVFYLGIELYRAEAASWARPALLRLAGATGAVAASMLLFVDYSRLAAALYIPPLVLAFAWALRRRWASPVLSFFGRISYSLYLYHTVLGYALLRALQGAMPVAAQLVAALALSIAVAYLSFRAVEEPGVRCGRRLEDWWRPRAAPQPAAWIGGSGAAGRD